LLEVAHKEEHVLIVGKACRNGLQGQAGDILTIVLKNGFQDGPCPNWQNTPLFSEDGTSSLRKALLACAFPAGVATVLARSMPHMACYCSLALCAVSLFLHGLFAFSCGVFERVILRISRISRICFLKVWVFFL
jgi:hypothetical protein